MKPRPFCDTRVEAMFQNYPPDLRARLLAAREMIFEVAAETRSVGELVETLKWSQPAYLPKRPRTGTTIRLDALKGPAPGYALYFHCQTNLVPTFREIYGGTLSFEGNRAIVIDVAADPPAEALRHCIALALAYHLKGAQRPDRNSP